MADHTTPALPDPFPPATLVQTPDQAGSAAARSDLRDPPDPPPGYALHGELARGGMGVIFTAQDASLGRDVVLKTVQARLGPDPTAVRRFVAEARITGRLEHPGIPPVHALGTLPDGRPFLAMKLIHGQTLDRLLRDRPDPAADRPRFIDTFGQIAQTLGFAHQQGYVHRDLKPANVMVGAFGEVQVMDWGLAKRVLAGSELAGSALRDQEPEPPPTAHDSPTETVVQPVADATRSDAQMTQVGTVVGTPAFMAPEQARGEPVGPAADVFGLGAILCAVLTGHPPYSGPTALTTLMKAAEADLSDALVRLDGCGADPELVSLCKRCLAANPDDRPADGAAVAEAIRAYRAGVEDRLRSAEVERAKTEIRLKEERRRARLRRALGAAVLAGVALALAGGWAFQAQEERRQADRERAERERDADRLAGRLRARAAAEAAAERADAAVRAGRAAEADNLLRQAEGRTAEADDADLTARVAGLRTDADTLRLLDEAVDRRWAISGNKTNAELARPGFEAAFARAGLNIGTTPPAVLAAKVKASRLADRLLAGLHDWLEADAERPGLVDAANAADPDPVRAAVRAAVAKKDRGRVKELVRGADGAGWPPSFVVLLGTSGLLPPAESERLLAAAYARHPTVFPLAIAAGAAAIHPQTPTAVATATGYLRAAVALRPDNVRGRLMLSTAYGVAEAHAASVAEAEAAVALAPDAPRPRAALGEALARAGRPAEAEAAFRAALDRAAAPGPRAGALAGLGGLLYARGDYTAAADAYRQAAELQPADPSGWTYYAEAVEAAGDLAGGLAGYERATRGNADNGYAQFVLGQAYLNRGRPREAAAALSHPAVADMPHPAAAFRLLGEALTESGQFAAADAAYARAAAAVPAGDPAKPTLDFMADRAKRTAALAAAVDAGLRGGPEVTANDLYGLAVRADVARGKGRHAEAVGLYERLFEQARKAGINLNTGFELPAARAAARASATEPADRRPRLRELARQWLLGEAGRLKVQASGPTPTGRLVGRRGAALLLASPDFAELRAGTGLMPSERAGWEIVWATLHEAAGGRELAPRPR